jgi:hypothetical protein
VPLTAEVSIVTVYVVVATAGHGRLRSRSNAKQIALVRYALRIVTPFCCTPPTKRIDTYLA